MGVSLQEFQGGPVDPRTIPSSPGMSKLLVLDNPGIQEDYPRPSQGAPYLSLL